MLHDELTQPLKRRSLRDRFWQSCPSALMASSLAIGSFYVGGAIWLRMQPAPFAGEPVLTFKIPEAENIQTVAEQAAPQVDATEQIADAIETGTIDGAQGSPDIEEVAAINDAVTVTSDSHGALAQAPIAAIAEKIEGGFLPKIASNGKTPFDLYSKPVSLNLLHSEAPKIVIILGGMGLNEKLTKQATKDLPGEVTFAFAPYGNNLQAQVNRARDQGHEVLLQLPLEPIGYPANNPGPKTLLVDGDATNTSQDLNWHLSRFAGYAGVINYMGGHFLSVDAALKPILFELKKRGLAFMEDGSVVNSVSDTVAGEMNFPVRRASIVIDQDPDPASMAAALAELEQMASRGELAIGTGSGMATTIEAIKLWAHDAEGRGIVIIPATAAFKGRLGS